MTKQEQLDLIRAKCIEANPEIVEQHSIDCDMDQSHGWVLKHLTCVVDHDPRLADVLWTVWKITKRVDYYVSPNGWFWEWIGNAPVLVGGIIWNLRKDDLTEQSDECVAFLYELLK